MHCPVRKFSCFAHQHKWNIEPVGNKESKKESPAFNPHYRIGSFTQLFNKFVCNLAAKVLIIEQGRYVLEHDPRPGKIRDGADQRLRVATGDDAVRIFLELMIPHHEGAVRMVEELLEQPGSAYDPVLLEFTADVTNDQETEIERMHAGARHYVENARRYAKYLLRVDA